MLDVFLHLDRCITVFLCVWLLTNRPLCNPCVSVHSFIQSGDASEERVFSLVTLLDVCYLKGEDYFTILNVVFSLHSVQWYQKHIEKNTWLSPRGVAVSAMVLTYSYILEGCQLHHSLWHNLVLI